MQTTNTTTPSRTNRYAAACDTCTTRVPAGTGTLSPAPRTIEAEREREAALSAALAELETLPIVESVERIGWVYLEEGFGERYFVNIKAAPIL